MLQAAGLTDRRHETEAGARRIAVLVPCYNEEAAIARVVADFRANLPDAAIYVYDNNSTDRTVEVARAAGATVRGSSSVSSSALPRRSRGASRM